MIKVVYKNKAVPNTNLPSVGHHRAGIKEIRMVITALETLKNLACPYTQPLGPRALVPPPL